MDRQRLLRPSPQLTYVTPRFRRVRTARSWEVADRSPPMALISPEGWRPGTCSARRRKDLGQAVISTAGWRLFPATGRQPDIRVRNGRTLNGRSDRGGPWHRGRGRTATCPEPEESVGQRGLPEPCSGQGRDHSSPACYGAHTAVRFPRTAGEPQPIKYIGWLRRSWQFTPQCHFGSGRRQSPAVSHQPAFGRCSARCSAASRPISHRTVALAQAIDGAKLMRSVSSP